VNYPLICHELAAEGTVCGMVYQYEIGCAGSKSCLSSVSYDATIQNMITCLCNKGAGHSRMSDKNIKHM
jgi:hypothetical protein